MSEGIQIFDARLGPIVNNAVLEKLCTGAVWSEGPVWIAADESVLWSDIPNNRMLRWSEKGGLGVWATEVDFTNGHTLDLQGALLHCSHGKRGIYRSVMHNGLPDPEASMQKVVDRYQGKQLNSPNDMVVKKDSTIWFTDPPYGILSDREGYKSVSELGCNYVFRFDPLTNTLSTVTDWVDEPNGLAFSPDESLLYVSDTSAALRPTGEGNHHIVVFDVLEGHRLENPRIFAVIEPGLPDGFRVDALGWLYSSSADSVQIFHPDGTLLGKILVSEKVGNLTFGGPQGNQLFIAASTSLYRITLNTQGAWYA
jgi:gluconolactonase